ncbi:hypothetical protein L798_06659 [Zootermopsis nevadensis]|uniref:Uncharacterized protein n=1 Tax=Zootermopsis nevadensis TaxID=136037 RepID=A0A067R8L9_ZOONE|nr:hypothetical protein L798_06659 [Zootermopsis nevadensis]
MACHMNLANLNQFFCMRLPINYVIDDDLQSSEQIVTHPHITAKNDLQNIKHQTSNIHSRKAWNNELDSDDKPMIFKISCWKRNGLYCSWSGFLKPNTWKKMLTTIKGPKSH